ncbi:hypothetical protein C6500_21625 [Candidatus Poribacteria bacterium]|nr:MAG: hypothetical protein C6500_21625 [Candidatus Poribacteria bacterium]
MVNHRVLLLLLLSASITVSHPVRGEIFTERGLVDIPTGRVLNHGIFGAGTYMAFQHPAETVSAIGEHNDLGNAIAIRLNFGLFDRVGVGLKYLWNEHDSESFIDWTATLKVQLLKEQEVGAIPSVAIGVEALSDKLFSGNSGAEANENPSAFLVVSKTFNLPRIHQFSGHLGVGTQRFAFGESPIGLFVGLSKEFQPAFARGDITMNLEFDGAGVNAGMRYITTSGLQVGLGAETLNSPDELRYLVAVSWTNEQLVAEINETRGLIKRATELAIEAKRAISGRSK